MIRNNVPDIIQEVGFDFHWSSQKVWGIPAPTEEIDISELEWHFDIPFWDTPGGYYDLQPREVLMNPKRYHQEYERILAADTSFPIDIMMNKGRWTILDGLHRVVKLFIEGTRTVRVRKISRSVITEILPS